MELVKETGAPAWDPVSFIRKQSASQYAGFFRDLVRCGVSGFRVTELGSFMVPIGIHHWLGFGGGHLRRMTPYPPPPTPPPMIGSIWAVTRRYRGVFRKFLAHRNRETVAHILSY